MRSVAVLIVSMVLLSSVEVVLLSPVEVMALPFNQDMVGKQPIHGKIVRPAPSNSIPVGAEQRFVESPEAAEKFTNPVKSSPASVSNGERLWSANCSPCHGKYSDGKYIPGASSVTSLLPGPDLTKPPYNGMSDGHLFRVIHFGGMALMPKYGWKFSMNEHWDLVNYIRQVQKTPSH